MKILFTISICLLLMNCKWHSLDPDTLPTDPCDSTYAYKGIERIILTKCTLPLCHEAGSENGDYTSFQGLKPKLSDSTGTSPFEHRVLVLRDMPAGGISLTDCEFGKLKKWFEDGAPE